MTFNDVWEALLAKNSKLDDPDTTVEFKAGNLKKLLKQVWDQSENRQKELQANVEKFKKMAEGPSKSDPGLGFMRDFFGM